MVQRLSPTGTLLQGFFRHPTPFELSLVSTNFPLYIIFQDLCQRTVLNYSFSGECKMLSLSLPLKFLLIIKRKPIR